LQNSFVGKTVSLHFAYISAEEFIRYYSFSTYSTAYAGGYGIIKSHFFEMKGGHHLSIQFR
jgi:hypothetical protein